MKKYLLFFFVFAVGLAQNVFAQAKIRKLPTTINHPAINQYAPYMSFDGDAIVYLSDNAEDYAIVPFFSYRDGGDWKDPMPLPKNVYTRLNYLKGYTLGPDGKTLFLSTLKSPGVGGFDIWMTERKGASWSEPKNLAVPINSRGHEACATLTPDGTMLYFQRCEKMDQQSSSGCKIFVSKKKSNGQWDEPVELPASINSGNSQAPRILADAETLIFSSDKFSGSKGGMDLYLTRFKNGEWTTPVPMDFVNTQKDDQYVSVNGVGRYLLRDSPGAKKNELVEYLIPEDLRPKGLTRVDGKVSDPNGAMVASYISVVDLTKDKKVFNGRPAKDGTFTLFLLEGSEYNLAIDPEQSNINFYSKEFDLTNGDIQQVERISATLKPIEDGDEFGLDLVAFEQYSDELTNSSGDDLKRLARVIKSNPNFKFEIQVLLAGYLQDSVQSDPDLTEVLLDSVITSIDDIDSLGQLYQRDSLLVQSIYHNDRTKKQAENIINYLMDQGIDPGRLGCFINSRPEAIDEKKKITVRVKAYKI
ncbi:MAG TPA: hypothetical protein VFW11_16355 [Cyclobacteriaceae bacterium]|nr:hypothetical protein [Cyclobacteriaceae bacterium]